jgi:hypothetical protein
MKDTHLTLRLPLDLAQKLDRAAELRGTAKSGLVREAVAHYLVAGKQRPDAPPLLAGEFAAIWDALPHLTIAEAGELDADVRRAGEALPLPVDPWE